jgi:hypothetical protein
MHDPLATVLNSNNRSQVNLASELEQARRTMTLAPTGYICARVDL